MTKLSSLSQTDKIKLAAELDGWKQDSLNPEVMLLIIKGVVKREAHVESLIMIRYTSSYDAIIPLIQKQPYEVRQKCVPKSLQALPFDFSPSELLDALLVASGKCEL